MGGAGPYPRRRFLEYLPPFLHFYPGLSRDDFYRLDWQEFHVLLRDLKEVSGGR